MEYVMVPVPEELVDEVKLFLQWEVGKQPALEDPPLFKDIFHSVDEQTQTILRSIAEFARDEVRPSLVDVSTNHGISVRELVGLLTEFNQLCFRQGGPMGTVWLRPDSRPKPDDRDEWHHRVMNMTIEVAETILGG